jgi:hypothetical protein
VRGAVFFLRSRLNRNLANIGNPRLFTQLRCGTKRLIDEYSLEVLRAIALVGEAPTATAVNGNTSGGGGGNGSGGGGGGGSGGVSRGRAASGDSSDDGDDDNDNDNGNGSDEVEVAKPLTMSEKTAFFNETRHAYVVQRCVAPFRVSLFVVIVCFSLCVVRSATPCDVKPFHVAPQRVHKSLLSIIVQCNTTLSASTSLTFDYCSMQHYRYGRSALMLSGGATNGLYHLGVCTTLLQNNLLPRIIAGSSVGAIFVGIIGTHTEEELTMMDANEWRSLCRFAL